MPPDAPVEGRPIDPVAEAIELLARQGYESTTVEELADVAKISRSTFFRRFRSKEDIVFADHELLLTRLIEYLEYSREDPLQAVCAGARLVFNYHIGRREASLARNDLLHSVPVLRDRELVTSHRYERAFTNYLQRVLPEGAERDYGLVAFAAAVVAVHNAVLREWLRDPETDRTQILDTQLSTLVSIWGSQLVHAAPSTRRASRIVVAVFENPAAPEAVIEAVKNALR